MKVYCILLIVAIGLKSNAQTYFIPIGKDSIVFTPIFEIKKTCQREGADTNCAYRWNYKIFSGGHNQRQLSEPFHYCSYPNSPGLCFQAKMEGIYQDTFLVPYPFSGYVNGHCTDCNGNEEYFLFPIKVVSYADDVKSKLNETSLFIYPNPSSGLIELSCTFQNSSSLHLHIFDELGRDVIAIFDGMMNEPHREFSVNLSPGMYYARMETPAGVVTKKVAVE